MNTQAKAERYVFVSYARSDSRVVLVAVALLRAGGAKVFLDVSDIEYGDRWERILYESISQCERVLVFWSATACKSDWVDREWRLALKLQKRIVPVTLDDTPLPPGLAQFQGMEQLKNLLLSTVQTVNAVRRADLPKAKASRLRSHAYWVWGPAASVVLVAIGLVSFGVWTLSESTRAIAELFHLIQSAALGLPWLVVPTGVLVACALLYLSTRTLRYKQEEMIEIRIPKREVTKDDIVRELVLALERSELGHRFVEALFADS